MATTTHEQASGQPGLGTRGPIAANLRVERREGKDALDREKKKKISRTRVKRLGQLR